MSHDLETQGMLLAMAGGVEMAMVSGVKVLVPVQARDSCVFGLVGEHPGVFS